MVRAPLALLAAVVLAALASAGCNRVEIVNQDPVRAAQVKELAILPFSGVDVKKYQVKSDGGEEAEAWNRQAQDQYGSFPRLFSEEVVKHSEGARIVYSEKEPASGYFVKGLWEKVTPGSSGLRIGGVFTPTAGAAMAEEGKVEVRFTCWLKEVGKNSETPIATFSGYHENKDTWFGGYDAVWDLAEVLAEHLAERIKQVAPGIGGK